MRGYFCILSLLFLLTGCLMSEEVAEDIVSPDGSVSSNNNPNESIPRDSGFYIERSASVGGTQTFDKLGYGEISNKEIVCRYSYSKFANEGQGNFVISRRQKKFYFYMEDSVDLNHFHPLSLKVSEVKGQETVLDFLLLDTETKTQLVAFDAANTTVPAFPTVKEIIYELEINFHKQNIRKGLGTFIKAHLDANGAPVDEFTTHLKDCYRL